MLIQITVVSPWWAAQMANQISSDFRGFKNPRITDLGHRKTNHNMNQICRVGNKTFVFVRFSLMIRDGCLGSCERVLSSSWCYNNRIHESPETSSWQMLIANSEQLVFIELRNVIHVPRGIPSNRSRSMLEYSRQ